ncbi:MAG TPA: LysR substrate-binding domain-containing protein, partial [Azospirillaceae bacterium]|nr:LysR substrate-binding domain-containing protein [Azospirillaceae bacterium]
KAERLAGPVRHALVTLEQALGESAGFEPRDSRRTFRIHMSDIGEGRFLPPLMGELRARAPGLRIETLPVPRNEIGAALDAGRIDVAFGFLPMVKDTQKLQLLKDRYIVLLRRGHPFTRQRLRGRALLRGGRLGRRRGGGDALGGGHGARQDQTAGRGLRLLRGRDGAGGGAARLRVGRAGEREGGTGGEEAAEHGAGQGTPTC